MDPLTWITTRRMCARVLEEPPTRQEIQAVIEAAVSAPNHHLTEPWRFIVLSGSALDDLGEVLAERARHEHEGAADLEQRVQKERSRPKRAPVIVTVVYVPSDHPKAIEMEDRYAVGAAVENMLLAAHGMGLGAFWRTGAAARDPGVRSLLGLKDGEEIAAFVYLGYPLKERPDPPRRRKPASDVTTWLGSTDR